MARWRRFRLAVKRLLTPARRFAPTREGWWFLIGTLLVGLAAINSGFNLLFLVWGMMIFLILASGVMSELGLQGLHVTRHPPAAIHAGRPYLMGIAVRNDKKRFPSFALEIEDLVGEKPFERRCYFFKLQAGRQQQTAYRTTLPRRGALTLTAFRVSTRFPFGIIRKSRDFDEPLTLTIYPALGPVPADLVSSLAAERGVEGSTRRSRRGEFLGLREFRQGDDPRDIHWPTSAKRGRPFVRESEDELGHFAVVLLENRSRAPEPAFEAAVSMAASIAVDLLARGFRVGLGSRTAAVSPGDGPAQAVRILTALALIGPAGEGRPIEDPGGPGARIRVAPGPTAPLIEALPAPGRAEVA